MAELLENAEGTEVVKLSLEDIHEISPDELAALFSEGCELVVAGALSEWGSHVEEFIHKLERGVSKWHQVGKSKKLIVHFVEKAES
jgi:hypothetical protein